MGVRTAFFTRIQPLILNSDVKMFSFLLALAALILGYLFYGRFISRVFGVDDSRQTPCYTRQDGIDYIPMPTWKVYMIQFLNIAGLGPIFGAIMGAKFGTASYLWIVLGTIFAGATHDYLSGMISLRMNGASLPEIIGFFLGRHTRRLMGIFITVLMILVGAVFISGPAELLGNMTAGFGVTTYWWIGIIFIYYVIATLCVRWIRSSVASTRSLPSASSLWRSVSSAISSGCVPHFLSYGARVPWSTGSGR